MIMLIGSFFAAPFTLIVAGIAYQLEKTFVSAASGPIVAGVALGIAYFAAPNRQNFMAASEGLVVQVIVFGVLWSLSAWLFSSKTIS